MLSDEEIDSLLKERKLLPANWPAKLRLRRKEQVQHSERALTIERGNGTRFRMIARQNSMNPLDFSVVLVYQDKTGKDYRLRRYNGKHPSGHTNIIEKAAGISPFYFRNVFHIHTATERYQSANLDIDGFAEPTSRYADYHSAVDAFLDDHNFAEEPRPNGSASLF